MKLQKILSVVLVVVLLCSFGVSSAYAGVRDNESVGVYHSGITGDCSWDLDSYGTLTVFGTGKMAGYNSSTNLAPWNSLASSIYSVVICSGVNSIGSYAFYKCTNLENVSISDSVNTIGTAAFYSCTKLNRISIPVNVHTIGNQAFNECSDLTDISVNSGNSTFSSINGNLYEHANGDYILRQYALGKTDTSFIIPEKVTKIGDYAFNNCVNLNSLKISSSITEINPLSLRKIVNLESISVDSKNNNFSTVKGDLYDKKKTQLIQYAIGKDAKTFTFPSTVKKIGAHAFLHSTKLNSIIIPKTITSIGQNTFYDCTGLKTMVIPSSITEIASNAFHNCSSLEKGKIYYTGSSSDWSRINIDSTNSVLSIVTKYYNIDFDYFINEGETISITANSNYKYIAFIPSESKRHFIYSTGNCDTYGSILKSDGSSVLAWDDDGGAGYNFRIEVDELEAGQLYFIEIYSDEYDSYKVTVERDTEVPKFGAITQSAKLTDIDQVLKLDIYLNVSDNMGIKGYYWGTNENFSDNDYVALDDSPKSKKINKELFSTAKCYCKLVDTSGNESEVKTINVSKVQFESQKNYEYEKAILSLNGEKITLEDLSDYNSGDKSYKGWSTNKNASTGVRSIQVTSNNKYYAIWGEPSNPIVSISEKSTNANKMTVTYSVYDEDGLYGYYWGTSPFWEENSYYGVSSPYASSVKKTITAGGKYYFTSVNRSWKTSNTVSVIFQGKQTITAKANSFTKKAWDSSFSLGAKAKTKLTYKTSNKKVATVSASGKVTIKGAGTAKITITAAQTAYFKKATKVITVKVKSPDPVRSISYTKEKASVLVKWNKVAKASAYEIEVSYSKSFVSKSKDTVYGTSRKINSKKTFYFRVRSVVKGYKSEWKTKRVVV